MLTIFVIALLLSVGAANFGRVRFEEAMKLGSRLKSPGGQTAAEVAREFLDTFEATDVMIVEHNALVTDYFDPVRRTLFLHREIMQGTSAAAWAVALHEAAHATQTNTMRAALDMRRSNIKLTRYVPALSAAMFAVLGFLRRPPFAIGWRLVAAIWFVVMALNLLSLPIEFNASQRALAFLERKLRKHPEALERLGKLLSGVAWRDTAVFLRSPVYCLFGALPVGGTLRPR
ncbi:MAG TPA: zinc metallopeptidase [Verrucomicrobiaceae bacterium]